MAILPSLVAGPTDIPLYDEPLGTLLKERVAQYGDKPALVSCWQNYRASFKDLDKASSNVARALIDLRVRRGQHVGVFAGNRHEYIDVFLGGARIGRPVVVLNSMYTPTELCTAVERSDCKAIFIANRIGKRDLSHHIEALTQLQTQGKLRMVVVFADSAQSHDGIETYTQFLLRAQSIYMTESGIAREEQAVKSTDVLNLQFTSGTTGMPKAAMLTHRNLINNGRYNGEQMRLVSTDILCCPPPLFHCFGLVMGFLNSLFHGCTLVMANDDFDPERTVAALIDEKCTATMGVPTMFLAQLAVLERRKLKLECIRTGLAAGSIVPEAIMKRIKSEMGCDGILIAYGMTETSPVTFMTSLEDPEHLRGTSLGKVLPHTAAKVIDSEGNTVPRGVKGELCTSGYALQLGYYKNQVKTDEAMRLDEAGVLWMHTGDECYIDEAGYCYITGRLKDLIIRGTLRGENIHPREIEDRLLEHPAVGEVSVVAIKDERYGEAVGAFLRIKSEDATRPTEAELRSWVMETLGRHKVPAHAFWIGDDGVGSNFPTTPSGKMQKHIMSALGNDLIAKRAMKAKL